MAGRDLNRGQHDPILAPGHGRRESALAREIGREAVVQQVPESRLRPQSGKGINDRRWQMTPRMYQGNLRQFGPAMGGNDPG